MLIEYGLMNFFSFKEQSSVAFTFDGNTPEEVSRGRACVMVMGIKGANSSGKTNLIKALSFLGEFVVSSARLENYRIPLQTFMGSEEPTALYVEFRVQEKQYRYELVVQGRTVHTEQLKRKRKKWVPVFTRDKTGAVATTSALEALKEVKLNPEASLISTLSAFKFFDEFSDIKAVFDFFDLVGTNVGVKSGLYRSVRSPKEVSQMYQEHPDLFAFAVALIKKSDMGITDIDLVEDTDAQGDVFYKPVFKHAHEGGIYQLQFGSQSRGTQELYILAGLLCTGLQLGGVLAIDELDIHLHAMLLPVILDLFESPETNPKSTQLIFTSHNTEIMDILGRYRTVLVNKEQSESYCYRLDEIGGDLLRNDRPISPAYRKGLIGGVPVL